MTDAAEKQLPARKERPFYQPGWYKDLSNEEYHGSYGYSSSVLKMLTEMPYSKMDYKRRHPTPPSEPMKLGTAVHTMSLEPNKTEEEILVMPEYNLRRPSEREEKKLFLEANKDKLVISAEQFDQAEAMAKNLRNHPQIGLFLEDGMAEQSVYYWYNPEDWDDQSDYRIMCKIRPDWLGFGHPMVFDLKTSKDASFSAFMKDIKKLNYHMSAAMYLDGINRCPEICQACGVVGFTKFVWIVVESEPPYECASYEMTMDDRGDGDMLYHSAVRKLHQYQQSDWKGYGEWSGKQVLPITRPSAVPKWGNNIV